MDKIICINNLTSREKNMIKCLLKKTPLIDVLVLIIISYIDEEPNIKGKLERVIGKCNIGTINFKFATGLGTHGDYVYVCDKYNGVVRIIDKNGDYIGLCGSENDFRYPSHIAISESRIYIADGQKIQVFNIVKHKYIKEIKLIGTCSALSVYKSRIYVLYLGKKCIYVYDIEGTFITCMLNEQYIQNDLDDMCNFEPPNLCVRDDEIYFTIKGPRGDCVICLSISGLYNFCINGKNNGGEYFDELRNIALTKNSIYIADRNGIHQFDRINRQYVKTWGTSICCDINSMTFVDDKCFIAQKNHLYIFI